MITKTRHDVPFAALTWEVDVVEGANAGLVVAELELRDEGQAFQTALGGRGRDERPPLRQFQSRASSLRDVGC